MPTLPARVIFADSERDPDILYATRFFAPDAFLFLEQNGRRTVVLSDLEVDRGRAQAQVDEVLSLTEEAKRLGLPKKVALPKLLAFFLKDRKVRRALVPGNFPLGLAASLRKAGIRLSPVRGLFWAERESKSADELKRLREALAVTEAGMARAMEVLRAAAPASEKNPVLRWGEKPLTSEVLRAEIDSAILRAGGAPANTIVAGGLQACDPHERGSGALRAGELIILDLFPRHVQSGYFGDMTRTVVRGRASEAQRHLWETVRAGQEKALRGMKPGVEGRKLHEEVKRFFKDAGYPTEQSDGRWRGFFHGTGHGLGLELHEPPRFGATTFKPGQVLTVEPGIYWPGIGGARLEDVVTVTDTGVRMLSRFPKTLEV
jgi:Xaa-Pro aminopeptidase